MQLTDEEGDDEVMLQLKKQARVEARAFFRLSKTKDGKMLLATIKRDIGWDQAGPPQQDQEHPIHHWLGQRSMIVGIEQKITLGSRLLREPEDETKPTNK